MLTTTRRLTRWRVEIRTHILNSNIGPRAALYWSRTENSARKHEINRKIDQLSLAAQEVVVHRSGACAMSVIEVSILSLDAKLTLKMQIAIDDT